MYTCKCISPVEYSSVTFQLARVIGFGITTPNRKLLYCDMTYLARKNVRTIEISITFLGFQKLDVHVTLVHVPAVYVFLIECS